MARMPGDWRGLVSAEPFFVLPTPRRIASAGAMAMAATREVKNTLMYESARGLKNFPSRPESIKSGRNTMATRRVEKITDGATEDAALAIVA